MAERELVASFTGQLFEAAATTKKWSSLSGAGATIQITNLDEDKHQLVGLDKDHEVLVHDIDTDMQLRSKDNFVQWRKTSTSGKAKNYGVRLKDARESQRLEGIVGGILAMLEITQSAALPAGKSPTTAEKVVKKDHEPDTLLKVHLPGKQTTVISAPPSITIEGLLIHIAAKRHLDPRCYELALPPSKPKSMQAQFLPSTVLRTLNINEIHVVKRSQPLADKKQQAPAPTNPQRKLSTSAGESSLPVGQKRASPPTTDQGKLSSEQKSTTLPSTGHRRATPPIKTQTPPLTLKQPTSPTQKQMPMAIIKVHLPYDQRTVVQVSPLMTMPQFLMYICEKRNLNPAHHSLALPSPTSGQMRVVAREMTVSVLRNGVITLVDLKGPLPSSPTSTMPDYNISGKKGSFSPKDIKPVLVDSSKKRNAPTLPMATNESKRRTSQDVVSPLETKTFEKSEKEQPIKLAKRKAPPPPKGAKKETLASQPEPEISSSLAHLATPTKQVSPATPTKRPAPAVPTAKQATANKQMSKQTSDSVLTKRQAPPSPLKIMASTTEDVSDQQQSPPISAAKKRRPAPVRPAQRKLEPDLEQTAPMDTTVPKNTASQLQPGTVEGRPMSATSAQFNLEIHELEASLADTVKEAEKQLQEGPKNVDGSVKQDQSADGTDSAPTPMEIGDGQPPSDKIVEQPQAINQVVSETGTVRGIKGRVKEQIASNQSKMMVHGLMKKQQSFTRTPLAVMHRAGSNDEPQMSDQRASLKRSGSQEDISNIEQPVFKRSNSQKVGKADQSENKDDKKSKPRGKAPPPPQGKVKPQQDTSDRQSTTNPTKTPDHHSVTTPPKSPDHQFIAAEEITKPSITATAEDNQTLTQNRETLPNQLQTTPSVGSTNETTSGTPDKGKKVPPKVKPKTARPKSKEAEDNTTAVPVAVAANTMVKSIGKRTKSDSHLKLASQISPKSNKKPAAIIESSDDGRQVLVLSPSSSVGNTDKADTSVRIFLPPPPPTLPPSQEQVHEIKPEENKKTDRHVIAKEKIDADKNVLASQLTTNSMTAGKQNIEKENSPVQDKGNMEYLTSSRDVVDSEKKAIGPLPHVGFLPVEVLPPTPPGTPNYERKELKVTEVKMTDMKMIETKMAEPEVDDNDDMDVVPPPVDDFSIDELDGVFGTLPPPDDFDPLSLPPPLPLDDSEFDSSYIIPPPPSTDDTITEISSPPLVLPDDSDVESFDLPDEPPSTQTNDEVVINPEGSNNDKITVEVPSSPTDDTSLRDVEPPETMTENIASEVEITEQVATVNTVVNEDATTEVKKLITDTNSQLESTRVDAPTDEVIETSQQTTQQMAEIEDSQDELSNLISTLETMLQDELQSDEAQPEDDTSIQSSPFPQQPDLQKTEVAPINGESKDDNMGESKDDNMGDSKDNNIGESKDDNIGGSKDDNMGESKDNNMGESKDNNMGDSKDNNIGESKDDNIGDSKDDNMGDSKDDNRGGNKDGAGIAKSIEEPNIDIKEVATALPKPDKDKTVVKPKAVPTPARVAPPPPPPPPPVGKVRAPPVTPVKIPTNTTSPTNTASPTSPTKAKSPPPVVKPKPKRPTSGPALEDFQDELAVKLKKRQQKIQNWASDDNPKPTQTAPNIFKPAPPADKARPPVTGIQNIAPVGSNLQATPNPLLQASAQQTASPAGNQEQVEQIQVLQNQILQQQILQLQQQLQQLQQQIPPGQVAANPMMAVPQNMPGASVAMQIPQPGVVGLQPGTVPQMGMQFPQIGTGIQAATQEQNIAEQNPASDGITSNATSTPKPAGVNTSTDSNSESTHSDTPPPLPATSPPPLTDPFDQLAQKGMSKTMSDSLLVQRPPSQALRSKAFGEYEDALDDILEEVREVDHNTVLKKLPPPPIETGAGSPHTEMASLLAQAMKQRRLNITSKRSSVSIDEETDTSHEWD